MEVVSVCGIAVLIQSVQMKKALLDSKNREVFTTSANCVPNVDSKAVLGDLSCYPTLEKLNAIGRDVLNLRWNASVEEIRSLALPAIVDVVPM